MKFKRIIELTVSASIVLVPTIIVGALIIFAIKELIILIMN